MKHLFTIKLFVLVLIIGLVQKSTGQTRHHLLISDIVPGTVGSNPSNLTVFQGKLYFTANINGLQELFVMDNTKEVKKVKEVVAGSMPSNVSGLTVIDDKMYMRGTDVVTDGSTNRNDVEMWIFDGTSFIKKDLFQSESSSPAYFVKYKDKVYCALEDEEKGKDIGVYDPQTDEISFVDVNPSDIFSSTSDLCVCNDELYFSARKYYASNDVGHELYKYDGVTVTLAKDIYTGDSSSPRSLTSYKGILYFVLDGGKYFGKYDPANGEYTTITIDGKYDLYPKGLLVAQDKLIFSAFQPALNYPDINIRFAYTYDGSQFLDYGNVHNNGLEFIDYNGEILTKGFKSYDSGNELTNIGSAYSGTSVSLRCDINEGREDSNPANFCVFDGLLFFAATTEETGCELYAYTDGSKLIDGKTITYSSPENGTLNIKVGNSTVESGSQVEKDSKLIFDLQPNAGYIFKELKIKSSIISIVFNPYEEDYNIKSDIEVEAVFKEAEPVSVTYSQPANGSVTVKNGDDVITSGQEVLENTTLTVEVNPQEGYYLDKIIVTQNGQEEDITSTKSFTLKAQASIQVDIVKIVLPVEKPIVHYKFDGNTDDASGNNNNAIEYKAPDYCADINNNEGKAASFGSGNDIKLPKESYINLDEFTVNAWVYIENMTGQFHNIFGGVNFGNHNTQGGLAFGYRSDANLLYFDLYDSNTRHVLAGELPALNEWHMYTITYDKNFMRFYIDGVEVANKDIGSIDVTWASSTTFNIGDGDNVNDFNGRMDDFRLYGEAISAVEVLGLMESVPTSIDKELVPEVKVYPNPADYEVNVVSQARGLIEIFSLTGVKVHSHYIEANEKGKINTSNYASGIYLLRFKGNDGNVWMTKIQIR